MNEHERFFMLTLITESWKIHPEILSKFSVLRVIGQTVRPYYWKTYPCLAQNSWTIIFRLNALFWMNFPEILNWRLDEFSIIVILQLKNLCKEGFKSNFFELNMNEHELLERFFMLTNCSYLYLEPQPPSIVKMIFWHFGMFIEYLGVSRFCII